VIEWLQRPHHTQAHGALRTVEIDRQQIARRKRQKRTGDSLPKRAQAVAEQGRELAKERPRDWDALGDQDWSMTSDAVSEDGGGIASEMI
jgi:hypothetical protein